MNLVIWAFSVYGMAIIVTRSPIFAPLRAAFPKPEGTTPFFGTLFRCTLCFAFWTGMFHYAAGFRPLPVVLDPQPFALLGPLPAFLLSMFFSGCGGAGSAWFLFLVAEKLGQSDFLDSD